MKKFLIACLALCVSTIYALPVGNPSEASLFRFECCEPCRSFRYGVGFYGDYVFNRHMETTRGKDIDTVKLFTNAGYFVLNFRERADLFVTLGATRLSLNTSLVAFNAGDPFPMFELESVTAFSYSIGARVSVYEYKCFILGVEGQYFSTKPDVKRLYIAVGASSYLDDNLHTHYREWQLGAGVSYRYNPFFVPYVAVKYSRAHWKLADGRRVVVESNVNNFLFNLDDKLHWGYAVGLTLCPYACDKLAVTVEGRFSDEKALYVNGQIRF